VRPRALPRPVPGQRPRAPSMRRSSQARDPAMTPVLRGLPDPIQLPCSRTLATRRAARGGASRPRADSARSACARRADPRRSTASGHRAESRVLLHRKLDHELGTRATTRGPLPARPVGVKERKGSRWPRAVRRICRFSSRRADRAGRGLGREETEAGFGVRPASSGKDRWLLQEETHPALEDPSRSRAFVASRSFFFLPPQETRRVAILSPGFKGVSPWRSFPLRRRLIR
jgi:hypothetical protein